MQILGDDQTVATTTPEDTTPNTDQLSGPLSPSSVSAIEEEGLGVSNIVGILLIAVGVILILLAVAIILRLNR